MQQLFLIAKFRLLQQNNTNLRISIKLMLISSDNSQFYSCIKRKEQSNNFQQTNFSLKNQSNYIITKNCNPSLISIPLQPVTKSKNFSQTNCQNAEQYTQKFNLLKSKQTKKYQHNNKNLSKGNMKNMFYKENSNRSRMRIYSQNGQNYSETKHYKNILNIKNSIENQQQFSLIELSLHKNKDVAIEEDIGGWKDQNHNVLAQKSFNTTQNKQNKSYQKEFSFIKANKKNLRTSKYKQKYTFRPINNYQNNKQDQNYQQTIYQKNQKKSNSTFYTNKQQKSVIKTIQYEPKETKNQDKQKISKSFQFSHYYNLRKSKNYHKNKQNYYCKTFINEFKQDQLSNSIKTQIKIRLNSLQRDMLMSPINEMEQQNQDKTAELKPKLQQNFTDANNISQYGQCMTEQNNQLVSSIKSINQLEEFGKDYQSKMIKMKTENKQSHINLLKKEIQYLDQNQDNFFKNGKWERYPTSQGFYKPFKSNIFYSENKKGFIQGLNRPMSNHVNTFQSNQLVGVYLQSNQFSICKKNKQKNPFLIIEGVTTAGSKTHASSMYSRHSCQSKKNNKHKNPRSSSNLLNGKQKEVNKNLKNPNSSFSFASSSEQEQKILQFNAIHSKMDMITPFKKLYQNKKNLIKKSQHLNISITQLQGRRIKKIIDYLEEMNEQKSTIK